jgi:hypothetical protein
MLKRSTSLALSLSLFSLAVFAGGGPPPPPVVPDLLEILDRRDAVVEHVLAEGPVRLRVTMPGADVDPGAADLLSVEARTVSPSSVVRDTETFDLVETGLSTGVFTGQIPAHLSYFRTDENGTLESWQASGENDRVEIQVDMLGADVPIVAGILRIVDASGDELTEVADADLVRLHLESEAYDTSPTLQEMARVWIRSGTTGDEEYPVILTETGLDTGVFLGNFVTVPGATPTLGNAALETQDGETIEAEHETLFGSAIASALVVAGSNPANYPPSAVGDLVSTSQNVPIAISVLANDSDPDFDALSIVLFTQPTGGGTVVQTAPGTLTYTPPASTSLADSFTYRVADSHGAEAVGIVGVQVR